MTYPRALAHGAVARAAGLLVAWASFEHGAAVLTASPKALPTLEDASEVPEGSAVSLVQVAAGIHRQAGGLGGALQLNASRGGSQAASAAAAARSAASVRRSQRLLLWMLGHQRGGQQKGGRQSASAGGSSAARGSPPSANASCTGSGYFIDWGSSGMKVYPVHRSQASDDSASQSGATDMVADTREDFKVSGVSAESTAAQVQAILDDLLQHLPDGAAAESEGPNGAVLATAGMRLAPDRADALWASVRAWADEHPGIFGRCGQGTNNEDCKTLSGSEEAVYEMQSALRTTPGRELEESDLPFGFASAGGASMQVGVRGAKAELEECRHDLGALDRTFDPQRAKVTQVNSEPTLVVSFLSITDLTARVCVDNSQEQGCDYGVGGLDQMRARFDEYLVANGHATNPCLSPYAKLRSDAACSIFDASSCVMDRYGGRISGLPPTNASLAGDQRKAECRKLVQAFMDDDLVLGRWSSSPSCVGLAGNASRWALLSSFARETQLGADVAHGWEAFAEVHGAAAALDFATREEAADGEEGLFLTSMLLVHFLDMLGIRPDAEVQGMRAEWADEAMRERGLTRGWPQPGQCLGKPGSGDPTARSGSSSTRRSWLLAVVALLPLHFLPAA